MVSTIDVTLQEIVEKAIDEFQEKYRDAAREGAGSKTAAAIMMDPNTGEILAMSSNRRYDLNNPYDVVANGLYSEEDAANLSEEDRLNALSCGVISVSVIRMSQVPLQSRLRLLRHWRQV